MKVGDTIAGFEIVAQLKAGGMATLYLGRKHGVGGFRKHVAIKVVHPHLAQDRAFVNMFLDEARLSARIEHPNCVHVQDIGEEHGNYFLVMEYVQGCSLSQFLGGLVNAGRKLSPAMACFIAMRTAAGLHAAHELYGEDGELLNVVHRDVSPQNILLAYKGYVKLIDFGIAKARGRMQQTAAGLLKGKFRYMAPEQAAGRPVDRRCDVYALGIVLWETLTMRKLFDADNELALLDMVRNPEIPPPSTLAPEVPPALDHVVMTALALDREQRFASTQAFRKALGQAVPAALAIDDPQLGELLRVVMKDMIAQESASLPASAVRHSREVGGQVVSEFTLGLVRPSTPAPMPSRPSDGGWRAPAAGQQPVSDSALPVAHLGHASGDLEPVPTRPRTRTDPSQLSPDQRPLPAGQHAFAKPVGATPLRRDSKYPATLILDSQSGVALAAEMAPDPDVESGVKPTSGLRSAVGPAQDLGATLPTAVTAEGEDEPAGGRGPLIALLVAGLLLAGGGIAALLILKPWEPRAAEPLPVLAAPSSPPAEPAAPSASPAPGAELETTPDETTPDDGVEEDDGDAVAADEEAAVATSPEPPPAAAETPAEDERAGTTSETTPADPEALVAPPEDETRSAESRPGETVAQRQARLRAERARRDAARQARERRGGRATEVDGTTIIQDPVF